MHDSLASELRAIFRLAGPLIAAQLASVLMIFTDTVMMGMLGAHTLAAGSLGASAYHFVSIVCVGMLAAVGNLIAIRHGAEDPQGVTRLAQNGLWLGWALALIAGVLLWNLGPLLLYFGQQADNVHGATEFLSTLVFALPGYMSFIALRGFTSAIGRPGPVMTISIIGALANALLNIALIKGWLGIAHLGLAGIGLVTAVVMNSMALALCAYVMRHPFYRGYRFATGLLRPRAAPLKDLLQLGFPIAGTYAVEAAMFSFAALSMGALGSQELAAHQVAVMAVYVAFMVPVGISYAVTFRIGQHFGAGRMHQARRAGRLGIGVGALCMLGFATLFWLAPHWVVGLFLDTDEANYVEIIRLAVSLLVIAAWFEFFDGIQTIAMGAVRGLKDAQTTFWVGAVCYWLIGAPLAWLLAFPLGYGAQGVWWGLAGGLASAALGLTASFEYKTARLIKHTPATTTT